MAAMLVGARRLIRQRLSTRGMCDVTRPLAARMSDHIAKTNMLQMRLDVLEKSVLADVLLGLVKNNELTVDQVQARLPEFAVEEPVDRPTARAGTDLRFELGRTVECRMGPDEWARGKVIGHNYREEDWPTGQHAPYQVLLEGDDLTARTVYAPSDTEECIRAALRFPTGAVVECCVGVDQWVRGEVVAHWYREDGWPAQLLAPYRVRLALDASVHSADGVKEVFIWAPVDLDQCIRATEEDTTDASQQTLEAGVTPAP